MYKVRHTSFILRMMDIIDIHWEIVTDYLWETSEFIMEHELKKKDLIVEELETCILDPGGMLNTREPWKQFSIGKHRFEVQLYKIDWVILKVERADERLPDGMRFEMWRWNVVCSKGIHKKLLEKLKALAKTDETLHSQISDFELKEKMENSGYVVFPEIPREE